MNIDEHFAVATTVVKCEHIKQKNNDQNVSDEDYLFCMSLVPYMNKLDGNLKFISRVMIMQILINLMQSKRDSRQKQQKLCRVCNDPDTEERKITISKTMTQLQRIISMYYYNIMIKI